MISEKNLNRKLAPQETEGKKEVSCTTCPWHEGSKLRCKICKADGYKFHPTNQKAKVE